jgi:predicted acylesterase/phospholipase RssA
MTVAIERLGLLPMFDAVYGSSAGALNAAWLLCGRAESTMHAWWDPLIMRTTINPRRALRRQPVVDTRFLGSAACGSAAPSDGHARYARLSTPAGRRH